MIFDDELEKIKKIQQNLEKIHEHNTLFLKTMNNIQILIKNHMAILSQLVVDTESLYNISCDAIDTFNQAEEIADQFKIH